jgi:WD40 repeat protein
MIATGAADNTVKLWDIKSGKCLKTWDFDTAVKRVEFSEDGSQLLAVTEKRMGFLGTIVVLDINLDVNAEQSSEKSLVITCEESKATVAGWSYLSKYIIAGHEDGSVSKYDAKVRRLGEHMQDGLLMGLLVWRTIRQRPNSRAGSTDHRHPMVSRPNLLHHRVKRQVSKGMLSYTYSYQSGS